MLRGTNPSVLLRTQSLVHSFLPDALFWPLAGRPSDSFDVYEGFWQNKVSVARAFWPMHIFNPCPTDLLPSASGNNTVISSQSLFSKWKSKCFACCCATRYSQKPHICHSSWHFSQESVLTCSRSHFTSYITFARMSLHIVCVHLYSEILPDSLK